MLTRADILRHGTANIEHFFNETRDALVGEECVILTCGPSLGDVSPDELKRYLDGKFVISVKQAYDYVPEAHIHILNTWNAKRYDYPEDRPLVLYEKAAYDPPVYFSYDHAFVIESASDISRQLALTHDFDAYAFDKQLLRPWGPGILYELGFFLAAHMKPAKITMFGWDIGAKLSPTMPHFYDPTADQLTPELVAALRIRNIAERSKRLHDLGVTYNRPRIVPEEVADCADVTKAWFDWFKSNGSEMQIYSAYSLAHDAIPRMPAKIAA